MKLKLENEIMILLLSKDKMQIFSKKNKTVFIDPKRDEYNIYTKITQITDRDSFAHHKLNVRFGKDNYYSFEIYIEIPTFSEATGYYEIIDFDSDLQKLLPYISCDNLCENLNVETAQFKYQNHGEIKFNNTEKIFSTFDKPIECVDQNLIFQNTHQLYFGKIGKRITSFCQDYLCICKIIYEKKFERTLYRKNIKKILVYFMTNMIITLTMYICFHAFENKTQTLIFYMIAIIINHMRETYLLNEAKKDYYLNLFISKQKMYNYQRLIQLSFFCCYIILAIFLHWNYKIMFIATIIYIVCCYIDHILLKNDLYFLNAYNEKRLQEDLKYQKNVKAAYGLFTSLNTIVIVIPMILSAIII